MNTLEFKIAMSHYLSSIPEIESCKFIIDDKDIEITELNGAAIKLDRVLLSKFETSEVHKNNQLKTNLLNANFKISQCRQLIKDIIMLHWSLYKAYNYLSDEELRILYTQEGISNFSYKKGYKDIFIEINNKNKLNLISSFYNFLYKFPFIKTCAISYSFLQPSITNINNVNSLDSTNCLTTIFDSLRSLIIEADIKEDEFLKFINELNCCPNLKATIHSVLSRDCVNSISGTMYNRSEYEKGLQK